MSYTVAVLARDALTRAELSTLLAEEGLFVVAELRPDGDLSAYRDDLELLVWAVDPEDVLRDGTNDLSIPLLAFVADADEAAHALRQGAVGVLSRDTSGERLLDALALLTQGLAVLEPLTPREHDVLDLLAGGLSNKVIAKRLGVSDHTVKFHLNAILSKLGATSRTEAVTRAVRAGLLTL